MISQTSPLEAYEPRASSRSINGVRVSTWIAPVSGAARGGDWCEAFAVGEDRVAISIGDVCGHGDHKYATMAVMRQAIRDAALRGLDPAETLAAANEFLRWYDPDEYATAIFGFLTQPHGHLAFANTGHPAPLLAGSGGASYLEYPVADLPLGVEARLLPELHHVKVPAASLLVFYTDGVTEYDRRPLTGAAQLHDASLFAYELPALQAARVIEKRMRIGRGLRDDAAILAAWTSP
jgi:serine phosphatase RsbU (regulator of sigma subunit)